MNEKLYIQWEKKFELGIPLIDNQHKKLVDMCNDLYAELLSQNRNSQSLSKPLMKTLKESVAYVKEHFYSEEKLMEKCGYPKLIEHKKKHEVFISKIIETADLIEKAPVIQSFQYIKFIYNWILEHIAHEDKLYVHHVLAFIANNKKSA